jgi:hypothetical protein
MIPHSIRGETIELWYEARYAHGIILEYCYALLFDDSDEFPCLVLVKTRLTLPLSSLQ